MCLQEHWDRQIVSHGKTSPNASTLNHVQGPLSPKEPGPPPRVHLKASPVIVLPQMVWASSNRLGCAIHTCGSINVWGNTWHQAVYLVCNYAIK